MDARAPKLLIGVGNALRRDEGVGVRAAEAMAAWPLPPQVEVFEAGTAALETAAAVEGRQLVVAVDAVDAGAEPGTVFCFTPQQLSPWLRSGVSVHDFHLLDALEEARLAGRAPGKVLIIGVQVADISPGLELSEPVQAALPGVLRLAGRLLGLRTSQTESWTPGLPSPAAT